MFAKDEDAQHVGDSLAIQGLISRIAQLADDGDLVDYVRCFTTDAQWEMPGAPRHGRADIQAGAEARRAGGTSGPGSNTRHVIASVAVAVDGDRATASAYWLFYGDTVSSPRLVAMGKYDDLYLRTVDGWQVERRTITPG